MGNSKCISLLQKSLYSAKQAQKVLLTTKKDLARENAPRPELAPSCIFANMLASVTFLAHPPIYTKFKARSLEMKRRLG